MKFNDLKELYDLEEVEDLEKVDDLKKVDNLSNYKSNKIITNVNDYKKISRKLKFYKKNAKQFDFLRYDENQYYTIEKEINCSIKYLYKKFNKPEFDNYDFVHFDNELYIKWFVDYKYNTLLNSFKITNFKCCNLYSDTNKIVKWKFFGYNWYPEHLINYDELIEFIEFDCLLFHNKIKN